MGNHFMFLYSSTAGIYADSATIEVEGSSISDNDGDGLYMTSTADFLGASPSFTDNTVTGNGGYAMQLTTVISFADAMLLSMAFPNIVGLFILAPKVKRMLDSYMARLASGEIEPYVAVGGIDTKT